MDPWKRESWILRMLCIFFFQFLFLDGIPLEKGVLDFEIGLWFFVPVFFSWWDTLGKGSPGFWDCSVVFSSSFFFLMGYPWKRESLILRLLCGFFFQFLFLDGIPLEKGVLDFEIALWFFVQELPEAAQKTFEKGSLLIERREENLWKRWFWKKKTGLHPWKRETWRFSTFEKRAKKTFGSEATALYRLHSQWFFFRKLTCQEM